MESSLLPQNISTDSTSTTLEGGHIQTRCPSCRKLYAIDTQEFSSNSPEFECVQCHHVFFLEISESILKKAQASMLNVPARSVKAEMQPCPRCQAHNTREAMECKHCGVIFKKLEMAYELDTHPTIARLWRGLMQDFSNIKKHMEFVDQCEDLEALPFALRKYQSLREAQPQDALSHKMWQTVMMRQKTERESTTKWKQWLPKLPLLLSGLLIFIGFLSHSGRNMIGFGVVVLFMALGIKWFFRGQLSLKDLWY